MKTPPKGWHSSHEGSGETSLLGTLFHSMLVAHKDADIPLFNKYFLPHGYVGLNGMPSAPLSRWGVASSLSDRMYAQKINENIHNIFGSRTPNKKANMVEKLGLEYMKELHAMEENNTIHHKYNFLQSKKAVKVLKAREGKEDVLNLVEAQTLLYSWFAQFKQCDHLSNHMVDALLHCEDTAYLYTFNPPTSRFLANGIQKTKEHDDWLSNSGVDKSMEINPWRVVPIDDNGDMVSQYFCGQEMVQQPYHSYTPYWTTIDYVWNADPTHLFNDLTSAISDPNVFPITVSKTHFLFCHRLLGFFCLRALPTNDTGAKSHTKDPINFRSYLVDIKNVFASQSAMPFSKYEDSDKTGLTLLESVREYPTGKSIYTINENQYANIAVTLAEEVSKPFNKLTCRNLAESSSLGSASARSYARRLKMFYGLCVGMAAAEKAKPYTLGDGGACVADSLIYSFNKQFVTGDEDDVIRMVEGDFQEDPDAKAKKVHFHGSLRSLYKADTDPWTWGEIVNEYSTSTEIPKPSHASEFIPSWKDSRKPITINVSGAPPIGFYHKERRCATCNGRVILTTPAHCKVENVQCPHCRHGKIEVNE